jgi:dihydropyrimidinase
MSLNYRLCNATVVTTDTVEACDLLIENGTITRWLTRSEATPLGVAAQAVEASGCYLFPGGIDPHTHLEMPFMGTFSNDDFEQGTRAALLGGTTTIIDFAMQDPKQDLLETYHLWRRKAEKAVTDYSFHMAITAFRSQETPQQMRQLAHELGVPSFKVFMAYKGALMLGDETLIQVLDQAAKVGGLVLAHAEHGELVDYFTQALKQRGVTSAVGHALSRPSFVEAEATARFLDLCYATGSPGYVVHMSCEEALNRLSILNERRQELFTETCIQYLLLNDSVYRDSPEVAARYVLSPPLRKPSDTEALWQALRCGKLHTVATDHCSFCSPQKNVGLDDFTRIPNGIAAIEHRMELLYSEGVVKERLSLNEFVGLTSTHAASIFGLAPQKGSLAVGADADVVVFDPQREHQISAQTHHMNVDHSVFEGWALTGKVRDVFQRGDWVVQQGRCVATRGRGRFLPRKPRAASQASWLDQALNEEGFTSSSSSVPVKSPV